MRFSRLTNAIVIFLLVSFAVAAHADDGWGNLKGQIKVVGDALEIPQETIDKDQSTCLSEGEPPLDDNLLVGKSGGLKDVFVMMYLKGEKPAVHPSYEKTLTTAAVLDNKNCRFEPHALFVRTGQPLVLKNSDDVGHNCHIVLLNSEENVNVPTGDSVEVKMQEPEKVPGNVVCDIHKWMDAVLLVRDEPYVAITDDSGNFEIKNIPVGKWKFQFWHKKIGYMRKLNIPDKKVGRRGEIQIEVNDESTLDLGELTLDSKAFKK